MCAGLRRERSWFGVLGLKGLAGVTMSGRDGVIKNKCLSVRPFHPQVFMSKDCSDAV